MRRADHGETLDAMAQHGPQQGHGLTRGQAAADRDEGAVGDPRREILKRRPLVVVGIYGAWGPSHLTALSSNRRRASVGR